ncbi:MAG: nitrogenase component 1 [Anaerohalosphaeraceae bacterium]
MSSQMSTIFTATRNPCRMCTPLGAVMVFSGIADAVPFLHGSQGCSTYIRRYLIGHFREPVDIACSNFSESSVIFGGWQNLQAGIQTIIEQYHPQLIGIATTCLAETIGEDLPQMIRRLQNELPESGPILVSVSTPSYQGSHTDGFRRAVKAVVEKLAQDGPAGRHINVFSGMISPEDIRHLKDIFMDFGLDAMILPDYSDAFDSGIWSRYEKNIESGTAIESIRRCGQAQASIEFGSVGDASASAGDALLRRFGTPLYELAFPIGVRLNDIFFERLRMLSGCEVPSRYVGQRSRLIDSYVDAHKYVFGKKTVLYGPADWVAALAVFLDEIGMIPVLCAAADCTGKLKEYLAEHLGPDKAERIAVIEDTDFASIEEKAAALRPDILIGDSNGYKISRNLRVPLVRLGLPIHDRIGASRITALGYRGTQQLFDRIVNALLETQQDNSPVGYTRL